MSVIKEIWCMPHSHLDIGYTHPQPLLLELQSDYISQAISLCNKTADYPEESRFCWTIEANYILKRWLKTAGPEEVRDLKKLIREGRICVAALPMHTTPNTNANEMVHMLSDLKEVRERLETEIRVAINHDVNGQPWTLGQIMLDSGIDFYLTGINIHFGGIPFERPASFLWEMADGRSLLSFLGEHYSLFSQFMFTEEHSTARMHEGVLEYVKRLEQNGYRKDFAFLTATNPPLYDNNCPDIELSDLIRRYNAEGHEQIIRMVTAQILRDKLLREDRSKIPVRKGDWTDYWNFGAGSTARETRVSRLAKQTLQKAEIAECFEAASNGRYDSLKEECYENVTLFDEHTWGASQSVTDPDGYETYSQLVHKLKTAYQAADLSGYLLSTQMERLCGNPHQSNGLQGIMVVNTSQAEQKIEINFPKSYLKGSRQLSALRSKGYVPYIGLNEEMEESGLITMKPFSYRILSFDRLKEIKENSLKEAGQYTLDQNGLLTPFYRITFDPDSGRILQVLDRARNRELLNEDSGYSLFEPVRETIDEECNPALRSTLFPRNVDLGNRSISQWNHGWKGKRIKPSKTLSFHILKENHRVTFITGLVLEGTVHMEQQITFYTYSPRVNMKVSFIKKPVYEPESIYFAIPLRMNAGWECSYDTAGEFVRLDEEQMGGVCRDWLTVDTGVSVYDGGLCVSLACPHAPLVQVGGFRFGKESTRIEREENPLLLAWVLNNYWDTNFMANQSGRMEFSYELFTDSTFDPGKALANGLSAQNPCVTGAVCTIDTAAADGGDFERNLLEVTGNCAILHIYPAKKQNAVNILLKNLTDEQDTCSITMKAFEIVKAEIVTVQEEVKETVEIDRNRINVPMPPRGFKMIRVTRK